MGDSAGQWHLLSGAAHLSPVVTVSPEVVTCSGETCHPFLALWERSAPLRTPDQRLLPAWGESPPKPMWVLRGRTVCMPGNGQNLPLFQGCFSTDIAGAFLNQAPRVLSGRASGWWGCRPVPAHCGLHLGDAVPEPPRPRAAHAVPLGCLSCPSTGCRATPEARPGLQGPCHPSPPSWLDLHEFSILNTVTLVSQLVPDPGGSGYLKTLQALKLRWLCRMMDFSVSLLQLIEQGEFLWTSLSSPHLYSSECLQSTRGWRSTKPGDIKPWLA